MSEILSTSESEWIRALDNMHDGALFRSVRDLKTGVFSFDYVSATWEKLTGVSAESAMSDSANVFVNILPDDFNVMRQNIYESDNNNEKFIGEVRYINPQTKKLCWLQISSYTRQEEDRVISNGFIFDVTVRKEVEADLFIEKARLKALNNMPDGTLFRSTRRHSTGILKFDYLSATWEKFTGVSAEDSLADMWNVFKNVPPEDMKILMQKIEESFGPPSKFDVEVRYNHPVYKTERWLHIWSYPRRDDEYTYSDGFIFDITERKNHELELVNYRNNLELLVQERTEELETANEELQAINEEITVTNEELDRALSANRYQLVVLDLLVEASGIGLWDMKVAKGDPTNPKNIFFWSDEFRRLLGYSDETDFPNILSSWSDKLHPEDKRRTLDAFSKHLLDRSGKTPYNIEYRLLRKTGDYGYFRAYGSTVRDEEGNAIRIAGALSDITEKKLSDMELEKYRTQLEQMVEQKTAELLRAKEKAEESDRLKSAFLANMSHEIRTPLNGILGIIQFMDADNISTEQRKEYMSIIEASSQQLTRIIEDVVDISKIESGQMTIQPVDVKLNELMNEMRLFFEAGLQANNKTHISLILDDSGFIDNCVIKIDPVRLRQVIINLVGNAVKFTERGHIRFGYHRSSSRMLEFVVEDTGIGIADSQREIIFERFRQAELGNNRNYGGSGLGLTISRSLVKLMGGEMWVESIEGKGSSFFFTISM